MKDVALEIYNKYGLKALVVAFLLFILFAIIFASVIWGLAQSVASPGKEVSVLWGLVSYTKSSSENTVSTDNSTFKIFDNITSSERDSSGIPVNKKHAPWIVRVEGQVSNAMNSYVYLIVDDDNGEWIQSGLGERIDKEFSGTCYLGANNSAAWLNRYYTISAVVTNKKYGDHQILDRSTVIVQSNKIRLYRTH